MRNAGVEPVIEAESLAVVGLVEVVVAPAAHLAAVPEAAGRGPRAAAPDRHPDGFSRFSPAPGAPAQKRIGVPVVYLVAPQVWAWREGRIPVMRRTIDRLLCIFPFEEAFFRERGIPAEYIGHPLAGLVRPALEKSEFFRKHRLAPSRQLVTVLPGSRKGRSRASFAGPGGRGGANLPAAGHPFPVAGIGDDRRRIFSGTHRARAHPSN